MRVPDKDSVGSVDYDRLYREVGILGALLVFAGIVLLGLNVESFVLPLFGVACVIIGVVCIAASIAKALGVQIEGKVMGITLPAVTDDYHI